MSKRFTTDDYIKQLKELHSQIIPLENYVLSSTKIKHKCLKCNYEWEASPNSVLQYIKRGLVPCPYCAGRKLIIGRTDLWTTVPEVAKLLANPEDGYKYTRGMEIKLDWKCPDCGTIIKSKYIHNIILHGLSCPLCNDHISTGHKLVDALLEYLDIEYINEKSFSWSHKRAYDVYIPSLNCIIETHGGQHYGVSGFIKRGGRTPQEEKENDIFKKQIARENGISKYIEIDCRESDFNWIKNSILHSQMMNIFDLSHIHWDIIYKNASKSKVLMACNMWNNGNSITNIASNLHLSDVTVQKFLHSCNDAGLCIYQGIKEKYKPVVCLNTKEVFENLNLASNKYNISSNDISHVCKHQRNRTYAGKLLDGTKLKWMFLEEYKSKSETEIECILNRDRVKKNVGCKKVICLNTFEVFNKIKDAIKKYDAPSVSDCCRHIAKYSGVKNGERLQWMYYNEYIEKVRLNKILDT